MIPTFIVVITLLLYVPLAGALLYVWWKYGGGELKVSLARIIFLLGSVALFGFMLIV